MCCAGCIVLAPVLTAAWPTVSASVMGAAAALGFGPASAPKREEPHSHGESVDLELEGSRAVTDGLSLDEELVFAREDITVRFTRDPRGVSSVRVSGKGHARNELEKIGREFAQRIVQQYSYHRLMEELGRQNFSVVSQEVDSKDAIHLEVRRFD